MDKATYSSRGFKKAKLTNLHCYFPPSSSRMQVLPGFVTAIHKDSVRRWNLWFSSAGVFSEGGRQWRRLPSPK